MGDPVYRLKGCVTVVDRLEKSMKYGSVCQEHYNTSAVTVLYSAM